MTEILAMARKDLRIEWRSKVLLGQVLPFALLVIVLFGLALNADRAALRSFTPGLFWVTTLFSSILVVQRSTAIEAESQAFEGLRLSGAPGWKLFVGKTLAVVAQLLLIEATLLLTVIVLYRASLVDVVLVVTAALLATIAIGAAGSLYSVLSVGSDVGDTILPLLVLPVLAPVLVAATRAFDAGFGQAAVNGWSWTLLLAMFAVLYAFVGSSAYGLLIEDT